MEIIGGMNIPDQTYQDIWLNGKVIHKGQRDCKHRYAVIKDFLSNYNRRFTVMDIGACHGYFGIRIAQDFDSVVVMVDTPGPFIPELCADNNVKRTMFLGAYLNADLLRRMSECEHFDVILLLSTLHHMPDWKEAIPHLMNMSDYVIIETPPLGDWAGPKNNTIEILDVLQTYSPEIMGYSKSHLAKVERPIMLFSRQKKTISHQSLYYEKYLGGLTGPIDIKSTFEDKTVRFLRKGIERDWIHGINLWNFRALNGMYPSMDLIVEKMSHALDNIDTRHGDIRPWNFIIDGDDTHLIDWQDNRNNDLDDAKSLNDAIGTFLLVQP